MRARRALAVAAALCLLAAVPRAAATESTESNWFLLTVTAGPTGAFDVQTVLVAGGTLQAPGPFVMGLGMATRSGSSLLATQSQTGETAVTTTRDLGAQHVTVQAAPRGGLQMTATGSVGNLGPGESASLLYLLSSTRLTLRHAGAYPGSGTATATVTAGDGARALVLAHKGGEGVAAAAGSVGAGAPTYAARFDGGVVGAFATCGSACIADWRSPDGRSGRYTQTGFTQGLPWFAGPAGAWSWSWTGTAVSFNLSAPPAVGIIAPIGDAWRLFAPRRA